MYLHVLVFMIEILRQGLNIIFEILQLTFAATCVEYYNLIPLILAGIAQCLLLLQVRKLSHMVMARVVIYELMHGFALISLKYQSSTVG